MCDYLGRADLEALGRDQRVIERLLHDTALTGHAGEPVVEAERLVDLLGLLEREDQADQ
jgi:hypothetical protein